MKKSLGFVVFLFFYINGKSQNVGIGTSTPNSSAQLDISSSSKGFLPPRMTFAQRNGIQNPATGLVVFCTDCGLSSIGGELQVFSGGIWRNMVGGAAATTQLGKIIFTKLIETVNDTYNEIWISNYDGSNQQKVNYTLPSNMSSIVGDYDQRVSISPDGTKVFFDLEEITTLKRHIYSCNIDGTNLTKVINGNGVSSVAMHAAY